MPCCDGIVSYTKGWGVKIPRIKSKRYYAVRLEESTVEEMKKLGNDAKRAYDLKSGK